MSDLFKRAESGDRIRNRTRLSIERLNERELLTASPMDVDEDGLISTADATVVIEVLDGGLIETDGRLDVNGDGKVSPIDALVILNNVSRDGNDPAVAANETAAEVTFAVIGDYGFLSNAAPMAALVNEQSPDFIVSAGDGRYGATRYPDVHGFYCDYIVNDDCSGGTSGINRFFAAAGNHDYGDGRTIQEYIDYFELPGTDVPNPNPTASELFYDVVQGPVHIFIMDSVTMLQDDLSFAAQREWLQAGLVSSQSAWQVVVLHHPPYSSGAVNGSNLQLQLPFADWGVDLVISGDDHVYERIERDGTTFVVNGLSGAPTYNFDTPIVGSQHRYNELFGDAVFTATETELTGSFVNLGRLVIDSFVVQQSTALSCDYVGDGDGCDISDLNALYAGIDGVPTPLTNELIAEWLDFASSGANPLKTEFTDIYVVGDVDLNGMVDSFDLGILLNSFGDDTGPGWASGNLNGDLFVDSDDLGLLINNFDFDSSLAATSASVECAEPGNCGGGSCKGCALFASPE